MEDRSIDQRTFSTERLPLACFLYADGRLNFVGCEPSANGKFRFVFSDSEGIGDKLEFEYERGALIPATTLFASQKFLRREISNEQRRNGNYGYKS